MVHNWNLEEIKQKLSEINQKGFISIPDELYRRDDGIIGQLLEREFGIAENNISLGDLGRFELKGIRKKKNQSGYLTLSHKTPNKGMKPIEIFHRFGYFRESKSKPGQKKKNLFVTVKGTKENSVGLRLRGIDNGHLDMVSGDEFICEWNILEPLKKINQIILVFAETTGKTKANDEKFHYVEALLLDELKPLKNLIDNDVIVIDFCIDQLLDAKGKPLKPPHDRGPHIRVPLNKIEKAYENVIQIFP